ncbi:MAG: hypothetical protein E3J78_08810 [Candidatus Cloacimonadota bacterium]|nr:MAG: hypothetical protein E3J78_08810 [Candidatus Cloacimonadota bacterium]
MKNLVYCGIILLLLVLSASSSFSQAELKFADEEKEEVETHGGDEWIAIDKFFHVAASAGITGLSYHLYHCQYNNPEKKSVYFSLSFATASGLGKEFIDAQYRKTGWSWKDITADAVGIALGYLLFIQLGK